MGAATQCTACVVSDVALAKHLALILSHMLSRVSDRDVTTQDSMVDEQGGLATEAN